MTVAFDLPQLWSGYALPTPGQIETAPRPANPGRDPLKIRGELSKQPEPALGMLTARQAVKVAALKNASPDFVAMRPLAMRFRGVLHSNDVKRLDEWLDDAQRSGIYAMQRFACKLRGDIHAVHNAVAEPWSNGQTEGQINRLKRSSGPCMVAQAPNCCERV